MSRYREPAERHSDDLIAAIGHAAHLVSRTMAAGFHLLAATRQNPDNSPAIKAATKKLNDLTDQLHKSLPANPKD
jgi:hypothetical protein